MFSRRATRKLTDPNWSLTPTKGSIDFHVPALLRVDGRNALVYVGQGFVNQFPPRAHCRLAQPDLVVLDAFCPCFRVRLDHEAEDGVPQEKIEWIQVG